MRRLAALMLVVPVMLATAAPPWSGSGDDAPSVLDPSVPLSYVGNDGSVSVGINGEGHTEGQLLGVFARSNTRAVVGQLWWDRSGAGGVQGDYNWLWGGSALEAREHPDQATVARLSFAIDQNGEHDRKSTLGFGIERRAFTLEGYVAAGISSARNSGSTLATSATTLNGSDAIGSYTEIETTAVQTLFQSKPYGTEFGLQLGRTLQPFGTRVHVGASTQDGNGARANTWSVGVDSPLGTRGWGVSALAEHVNRTGSLDAGKDDRLSVFVRYEFGKTGSFQPTRQLEDPAWITQSLAQPSTAHSRNVESYQQRRSQTTTVTRGPKQYSNHFPLAQADSATTVEGQSVSINVLANDSDPDGDRLGISTVTQPAHGSAAIAGGQVTYTPAAGYSGSDSFRYSASDGRGGSATAQVSVTVGARPDQPPLARDDNANVAFGQSASIDVLANDTDADGDTLAIVAVGIPLHGSATLSGHAIVYRAAPGYSGSDRFTYTISDGRGGSASASVVISVSARPNRVPIARDDAAATAFGQAVTIDALANDTDPDGDALSIVATTAPAHGSVVIAAHALRYTPVAGYAGTDAFRYTISDGRGGSASATVAITIAAQPDRAPIAADDSATTLSGQSLTIAVLANDTDPDGDPLTLASVTAPR
ncbi:MAG TPA: Ig-like domain-containing protein, partial [Dokdonella sp.]